MPVAQDFLTPLPDEHELVQDMYVQQLLHLLLPERQMRHPRTCDYSMVLNGL